MMAVVTASQERCSTASAALDRALVDLQKARDAVGTPVDIDLETLPRTRPAPSSMSRVVQRAPAPRPPSSQASADDDLHLGGGMLRMMKALASRSPAGFTIAQWATMSHLKRTGGTWSTYLSRFRRAGYVKQDGDLWHATDVGIDATGVIPDAPSSPDEVLAMWKKSLGGGAARMLDAIVAAKDGLSREELADAVGLARGGGTFGTYLSRVRSNGLIEESGGIIRAAGVLNGVRFC